MIHPVCAETYAPFGVKSHRCFRYLGQGRKEFPLAKIHHYPIPPSGVLGRRTVMAKVPLNVRQIPARKLGHDAGYRRAVSTRGGALESSAKSSIFVYKPCRHR